jgi:hypothetical protein
MADLHKRAAASHGGATAYAPKPDRALEQLKLEYASQLLEPERETEQSEPKLELEPKPEPKVELDIAAIYAARVKILRPNIGDEARFRAFDHTVDVCRVHYGADLEAAKQMVRAALHL